MTIAISSIHEVVDVFEEQGLALSSKLVEMLNEHYTHQTERRGCGYTQATRVLAEYINQPRRPDTLDDLKILRDQAQHVQTTVNLAARYGLSLTSWRDLLHQPSVVQFLQSPPYGSDLLLEALHHTIKDQEHLSHIHELMQLEESRLLAHLIEDIILPKSISQEWLGWFKTLAEKPKVGSCPMAEKFFLEIAHRKLPRQGKINIFTDDAGHPLMLEKLNMGDDHSCISLVPMMMNGVRLPAGCLLSVSYDDEQMHKTANKRLPGHVMRASECEGFWLLRLTTLAISPKNRKRAFSTHFQQQINNGLFSPDVTTLDQLLTVAQEQL